MKKRTLPFLVLTCIMMLFVVCRMDASANETLKDVSYTTRSYNAEEWDEITFSSNLSFSNNLENDTNTYKVKVNVTPIYNSVSYSYYNDDYEMTSGKITDSETLKLLNEKTSIVYFNTYEELSPVYNNKGVVTSFSKTLSSVRPENLKSTKFSVEFPDSYDLISTIEELGNYDTILNVKYSVKFKVTATVSLKSGTSLNVKLKKKSISGYANEIDYISLIVADQTGNYKIVKAKSSKPSIASVSSSTGKITFKKKGTCTITLTNAYGKSASIKVTVKPSSIRRTSSTVSCSLGTKTNLMTQGAVMVLGTPNYSLTTSDPSVVGVEINNYYPIAKCKKIGSAVLTFTSGNRKFSVRVKVSKAKLVLASSITLQKGDSRTISANECPEGIFIQKVTSINGLLSPQISSNARSLTLTANKSFSGTSITDKVVVTFNSGQKKTIDVKITQPKTVKKFSLKDVKIKLNRSYYNGSEACLRFTVTNKSSKKITKLKIRYAGILNEEISGTHDIVTSIPRGESKSFTIKVVAFDYLDDASVKIVSAS